MNPRYDHRQKAPLHWLLWLIAAGLFYMAWQARTDPPAWVVPLLIGSGLLLAFFAFCFRELRVWEDGDHLRLAFGPLPIFHRRIRLATIRSTRVARSSWIDGWGIHYLPGRGETWNLWGFDCVELDLDGRKLRIGSDDPEGLADFLVRGAGQG